jgi:putative Holliday junction resolvase
MGILASPLIIISRTEEAADIQAIYNIAHDNEVGLMVVGLPYNMDGSLGNQAEKVKSFTSKLKNRIDIPVEFRDERLSTVEAKEKLRSAGKAGRKTRYDAAAAALILQGYLNEETG